MTITEKILAQHAGKKQVKPGELINAKIDTIMLHDVTTTPAIDMLEKNDMDKVFDPDKIVITPDHFIPNKDIKSAEMVARIRRWAKKHKIKKFYDIGQHGVCHAILPEQGHVLPGSTIVAGDSHTCTHGALGAFATGVGSTDIAAALYSGELWFKVPETIKFNIDGKLPKGVYSKDIILTIIRDIGVDGALYKAMEFSGSTISNLSIEARMTITNMAIEAGGKSGIIEPDQKTIEYLKARTKAQNFQIIKSDKDANYIETKNYNAEEFEPIVAFPDLPSNGKTISEIKKMKDIKLDQAYLGSCF
jgi:3-isopropylmalate/(R)-2-methylmalate dehydratase large subunit